MKKLAGLIIILAVLVLGGYYAMGIQTEKNIKQNIAILDQRNGLMAEMSEYNRGWFCSAAKIKWRFHVPERVVKDASGTAQIVPAQDFQIEMPVKVYHGPIIFANNSVKFGLGYATSKLPLPKDYSQKFDALFTKESIRPELNVNIFVNYLNKSTLNFNLPSFKLITKDQKGSRGEINWSGLDSNTTLSSGLDKVEGSFIIKAFNLSNESSRISVGDFNSDYDLYKSTSGLYLGNAKLSLDSLDVAVQNQHKFQLNEFSASSDSNIDQNLFNTHLNMSVKSIVANGQTYGPGTLEMSLRNIDADILGQINQQVSKMKNGNDTDNQQNMLTLLPLLPKLFSKGAEFEVTQLNVKLPQGVVKGDLLVSLPKGDSNNPFELIQKIKGHAQLKVPAIVLKLAMKQSVLQQMARQPEMEVTLRQQPQGTTSPGPNQPAPTTEELAVMQADKQIAGLVQSGLIVAQGDNYTIELNLEQGKVSINGKPYDPSQLKF